MCQWAKAKRHKGSNKLKLNQTSSEKQLNNLDSKGNQQQARTETTKNKQIKQSIQGHK